MYPSGLIQKQGRGEHVAVAAHVFPCTASLIGNTSCEHIYVIPRHNCVFKCARDHVKKGQTEPSCELLSEHTRIMCIVHRTCRCSGACSSSHLKLIEHTSCEHIRVISERVLLAQCFSVSPRSSVHKGYMREHVVVAAHVLFCQTRRGI